MPYRIRQPYSPVDWSEIRSLHMRSFGRTDYKLMNFVHDGSRLFLEGAFVLLVASA